MDPSANPTLTGIADWFVLKTKHLLHITKLWIVIRTQHLPGCNFLVPNMFVIQACCFTEHPLNNTLQGVSKGSECSLRVKWEPGTFLRGSNHSTIHTGTGSTLTTGLACAAPSSALVALLVRRRGNQQSSPSDARLLQLV